MVFDRMQCLHIALDRDNDDEDEDADAEKEDDVPMRTRPGKDLCRNKRYQATGNEQQSFANNHSPNCQSNFSLNTHLLTIQ